MKKTAKQTTKKTVPAASPHRFGDDWTVEAEFRGETLHYLENGRRASIDWTWTRGYKIYPDSLRGWQEPDGSTTPLRDEERDEIVRRLVIHAGEQQGVVLQVEY